MSTFRLNEDTIKESVVKEDQLETKEIVTNNKDQLDIKENNSNVKEIILKGPLSHAYTEALNLLLDRNENKTQDLRQENVHMALHAAIIIEENEEEMNGSIPDSGRAFLYVYDGKKMGLSEVSNMYEELTSAKSGHPEAGYVGGVIENVENLINKPEVGKNLDTMGLSLEAMKIPLYYSRNACMNGLINFLRKPEA